MRLPSDWDAESASGWWSLHHLIHIPCGFRTRMAYDLVVNGGPFDAADARLLIYSHQCDPDDCST